MSLIRQCSLVYALGAGIALSSCEVFKNEEPQQAEAYDAANAYNTAAGNAPNTGYPAANTYGNQGGYDAANAYAQPAPGSQPYTQPPYTQPPAGAGYTGAYDTGAYQPPAAGSAAPVGGRTHSVVRGDTLSGISRRYGVEMNELMRANNLTSPDLIREGQKLNIP